MPSSSRANPSIRAARLRTAEGAPREALALCQRVLLAGGLPAEIDEATFLAGQCRQALGDPDAAVLLWQQGLRRTHDHTWRARFRLALARQRARQPEREAEARAMLLACLRDSVEAAPMPSAGPMLAWLLASTGDTTAAREALLAAPVRDDRAAALRGAWPQTLRDALLDGALRAWQRGEREMALTRLHRVAQGPAGDAAVGAARTLLARLVDDSDTPIPALPLDLEPLSTIVLAGPEAMRLRPGERLTALDGAAIHRWSEAEAAILRAAPGDSVTLGTTERRRLRCAVTRLSGSERR